LGLYQPRLLVQLKWVKQRGKYRECSDGIQFSRRFAFVPGRVALARLEHQGAQTERIMPPLMNNH